MTLYGPLSEKKFQIIKLLLDCGADPSISNEYSESFIGIILKRISNV